jgi:hypothetical protein
LRLTGGSAQNPVLFQQGAVSYSVSGDRILDGTPDLWLQFQYDGAQGKWVETAFASIPSPGTAHIRWNKASLYLLNDQNARQAMKQGWYIYNPAGQKIGHSKPNHPFNKWVGLLVRPQQAGSAYPSAR